jgi:hypothetical protein
LQASNSPSALFGFKPATLVGKSIETFIDTIYEATHNEKLAFDALMHTLVQW